MLSPLPWTRPRGEERRGEERDESSLLAAMQKNPPRSKVTCRLPETICLADVQDSCQPLKSSWPCSSTAPSCSSLCLFLLYPQGGRRSSFYHSLTFFSDINRKKPFFRTPRASSASCTHFRSLSLFFPQKHFFFFSPFSSVYPFFAVLLYSVSKETTIIETHI